jgi:Rrf2 family protein
MAHLTVSVEYAIHSLLWMMDGSDTPRSTRDLAELQGISQSFLAKIFPRLEKAGVVRALEGVRGGYVLARSPAEISFLDIVDAVEGRKPLFDCQNIRGRCALFDQPPPRWAVQGVCAVHKVMLEAEKAMRDTLAAQTLSALGQAFASKTPPEFPSEVQAWFGDRPRGRGRRPNTNAAVPPLDREVSS